MDAKLKQVLKGHEGEVNACDFGPKNLLATGSSDWTIRIWKWNTEKIRFEQESILRHHSLGIYDVRFSPQGTMLASVSSDGTAIIWDLSTSSPLCCFVHTSGLGLRVCRFSSDGSQLLTGGDDGITCLWDIGTRALKRTLKGSDENAVYAADFTPDGEMIVTGTGDGNIYLWDGGKSVHNKSIFHVEEAHNMAVLSCHFAPITKAAKEGKEKKYKLVSSGNDGLIRLWTLFHSGVEGYIILPDKSLGCHSQAIMSVKFSPDGKLLAATGGNKTVTFYDMESNNSYSQLIHHERHVGCCSFSRSGGLLATGSNDKTVALWSVHDQEEHSGIAVLGASAEESNRLHMMAHKNEAVLNQTLVCHTADINSMVFVSDQCLVSCSGDKTIKIFKRKSNEDSWIENDEPLAKLRYGITSASFCPKTHLLATGALDGQVTIWNTKNFEKVDVYSNDEYAIRVCELSPDGKWLAAAGDGDQAYTWDLKTKELCRTLTGHTGTIFVTTFSCDSTFLVTGCTNGVLGVWLLNTSIKKSLCIVRDAHDLGITCGKCSPIQCGKDTNYLVTGGNDSLIKVWKLSLLRGSLVLFRTLEGHGSSIMCIRFSLDGRVLATTSGDKTVRLWDPESWNCLRLLEGHSRYVASCAFSPNNQFVATGSNDKLINLWALSGSLAHPNGGSGETPIVKVKKDVEIPHEFICPITQDIFKYPVLCADGFIYEEAAIHEWLMSRRRTSPMTNLPLTNTHLIPQDDLRKTIKTFLASQLYG